MAEHNFSFEGGYDLRRMCASWFVSYAYHEYVDKNHNNWSVPKDPKDRIAKYNSSRQHHKLWLEKVKSMDNWRLNTNKIGLDAEQVKRMAVEVLEKIKEIAV